MKIKFGALVVDGRAKIGGQVASKNRAGSYLRNKVTPVNPNTVAQSTVRNRLTSLSQNWRGLTQAQRDAWNGAVSGYAKTDIFGDLRNPTGFNLYQRLNNNLLNISASTLNSPPTPASVDAFTSVTLQWDVGVGDVTTVTFAPAIATSHNVLVRATAPQSPGKSFVRSEFRQIAVLGNADTSPYDLEAEYIAKFGGLGSAGEKIFVELVQINNTTGQAGIPIQASTIVLDT